MSSKLVVNVADKESSEWLFTTLTERLAQAEREVQRLNRYIGDVCDPATLRLTAERDAALAKAEQAIADRMDFAEEYAARQTAKAEAAEKEAEACRERWLAHAAEDVASRNALDDLRARIEALVAKWTNSGRMPNATISEVCALMQPAKEETALELVAALEKMANGNAPMEALAKLRTLLQAASPSP